MRALYWLRNDLRIADNQTLNEFCQQSETGTIVWCMTPSLRRARSFRRAFALATLTNLAIRLKAMGLQIYIFEGTASEILPQLISDNAIETLFFSAEVTADERDEEQLIRKSFNGRSQSHLQSTLIEPSSLPFALDNLPPIFSSFRKAVEKNLRVRAPLPAPLIVPRPLDLKHDLICLDLEAEELSWVFHPHIAPGEAAAKARLQEYIWERDQLRVYKETRNGMINWNDSSKLSPWLSVGAISPRVIYENIRLYESLRIKNESTYWLIFELLWRDYFYFNALQKGKLLFTKSAPHSHFSNSREQLSRFENWATAQTGDDFVDANLCELNQTGWMSNRGRQIVASFLTKTLRVNWIWGAQHFESMLIDYDAANNWGNWAYQAGVGQDPRDRTFNTHRQAELYDPSGAYRKMWLNRKAQN